MNIREAFLKYFEQKGHSIIASANLVPHDPTLLFTNAGMVPFKSIFTGEIPIPKNPRATSVQTCIRAGGKHNDLENVGHTARHHTFFEMLGNFSFGDYFKDDAISYGWDFVTNVLEFEVDKLWVTVHDSDDEAYELWQKHISKDRIVRMGDKDNFWQMGDIGPCGPSSEIFYDQGKENFNSSEDYMGGDGDRFLEIWNLVFMQYDRDKDGNLTPLPKPSIDTGMGLERVVALYEGKHSNYDSSLFMPIINKVEELTKQNYVYKDGASFRVIADHIRSVTFLLSQGVHFSNEGRGYVLRRILRRAVRHGYLLGLTKPFMYKLVDSLIELMGEQYTYLNEKKEQVKEQIEQEEERFYKTIKSGIELFNEELKNTKEIFSGEVAFKLYDTYGFPLDLTQDMLKDRSLDIDLDKFNSLMKQQKERAKAAWKGSGEDANDGDFKSLLEKFGINNFVGYTKQKNSTKVLALLNNNLEEVNILNNGDNGWVMLENTPFYPLSGGQTGDNGELLNIAIVNDTKKFFDMNLSSIKVKNQIKVNDIVEAVVDVSRSQIAKHHSATHLLHATLRNILGEHVEQAGSLVEANRLRFDFSHNNALSPKELNLIQDKVNQLVSKGIVNDTQEMAIDEAKAKGAMALFGEKYGDSVRVVAFDKDSIELCGGTHVQNTSEIGTFIITKESGVSAGVRRIEAICGQSAYIFMKEQRELLDKIKKEVKNNEPLLGIEKLKTQIKTLKTELDNAISSNQTELKPQTINNIETIIAHVDGGDIKTQVDELKNRYESIAVLLIQEKNGKVLLSSGSKNTSVHAGNWIKKVAPILGGGGGGRPDFASAGGRDASKIDEAIDVAKKFIESL